MLTHIKNLLRDNSKLLALLCTLVIAILSLVKVPAMASEEIESSDKLLHGIAYFFLTIFWLIASQRKGTNNSLLWFVIVGCFFYGIIIEVLQGVITVYRTASYYDIIANTAGILVALMFFRWMEKKTS